MAVDGEERLSLLAVELFDEPTLDEVVVPLSLSEVDTILMLYGIPEADGSFRRPFRLEIFGAKVLEERFLGPRERVDDIKESSDEELTPTDEICRFFVVECSLSFHLALELFPPLSCLSAISFKRLLLRIKASSSSFVGSLFLRRLVTEGNVAIPPKFFLEGDSVGGSFDDAQLFWDDELVCIGILGLLFPEYSFLCGRCWLCCFCLLF